MPTATSTVTTTAQLPRKLKPVAPPSPPVRNSSAVVTLHTLYNRAARAFLLRQIPLVHSLLESAFPLLHPSEQTPSSLELAPYRCKWDLLRITLETTVYASPPSGDLPDSLRELLTQTPHSLIASAYHRSLDLFAPPAGSQRAALIPSALILTLVYSSLKLEAPDAGRGIIEDWLATRHYLPFSSENVNEEEGNYRKVVEAYCLHVLPKLEQWEYAKEFLDYESELMPDARESLKNSLQALHAQAISERFPPPTPVSPSPSPSLSIPRPYSPTPSSSSSSSLSSTTSMHTVVPATPRARSNLKSEAARRSSSPSSAGTATPRARSGLPIVSPPRLQHNLPRLHNHVPLRTSTPPSTYTLLKASLAPYLTSRAKLSIISLATFVLLLVLPLLVRRRRAGAVNKGHSDISGAELVRRRLLVVSTSSDDSATLLGRVLATVVRVVGDTIRMGGSGLV